MISIDAFYELCIFLEARRVKSIQCFPLRTYWVPCHIHTVTVRYSDTLGSRKSHHYSELSL
ncbi:hypothetical protein BX666DRAFT_1894769 [Dichotomocladium elegans]|nr:hypothetical protein BX666DRAFT_1894769 [Dichotomocladium elegans]